MDNNEIVGNEEFDSTNMFLEYEDIVSIEDIMKMLHIGKSAVYTLLKSGKIKSVRVGWKYIVPKKSVADFIKRTLS